MTYSEFVGFALGIIEKADSSMRIRLKSCVNDREIGRYSARFSDGTEIIARPGTTKVTVRFGSGHQAMVDIMGIEVA